MTETRNPPRFKKSSWAGKDQWLCTVCPFDTLDHGAMVAHARSAHPRAWEPGNDDVANLGPLAGVPFASAKAADAAEEAGLGRKDFEGRTPTGRTGYTLADVQAASNSREG